jgi:hypothetical protein
LFGFFTFNFFLQPNVLRINWPPLSWVVLKIDPHNTYIKKNWPPLKFSNDPMSVNLDKRPILNTFYRQKVWENKVTIPAHNKTFSTHMCQRFSWCFEGKSGICLVVYNLHLITMILLYHRNVRMDRKLMFYDPVLTSIFISFVYSTLNG